MARIIAVANQKGGVGKTTTVVNVGAILAEKGYRVLLVDLDPQAALTASFGANPSTFKGSTYHLLLAHELDPQPLVLRQVRPHLDLLPATVDLSGAEVELVSQIGREYLLQEISASLADDYDFILIDCGPSLGLLTVNALTAADEVLIPVLSEYLALRGVGILLDTVGRVRDHTNEHLAVLGIVVTSYDANALHNREVLAEIREMFGRRVFNSVIRRNTRYAEAAAANMPVTEYAPEHAITNDYRSLVEEILNDHL